MSQRSGFRRWIAPIFLIIVVLLSFSKILFHENYALVEGQDLTGQAYPWFNAAAYWFQNRTLLLWDPYVFSGKPNAGEPQTGLFYPINWFFFAWHFENGQLPSEALETLIILNFCLMSLFVYFLARSFGISTRGAVISGVVCGLGGLSSKMHSWLNIQSSFVWLPLVLLFYHKANKSTSRKEGYAFLLLCAACLAISFLAGHHQPPIQAAIFLSLYALYLKISKQDLKVHVPLLGGLVMVAVIAALLAAIQIFPSAEWGMRAYRWAGEYGPVPGQERIPHYVLENIEKVHPQDFLSIVVPHATTMVNLYVGPLVILLALAAAIFSAKKETRFFLIAAILFLFFSLGKYSILHTWLYTYVPGVWFAREGIYFLLPFLICVGILAGYGLDALSEGLSDPSNVSIRKFVGFLIQLIGIVVAILFALCLGAVLQDETFLQNSMILKSMRVILYLILICILLIFLYYRKISMKVFQTIVMAVIVIDLGSEISQSLEVSEEGKTLTPVNVYRNNELAKTVKDYQAREMFRVDDLKEVLPPNAGDAWLIYGTMGYTTTMDQHYFDLRASGWGQFSNPSALLNTRYFISPIQLDSVDRIWNNGELGIYRNPRAVSRVFTAKYVKIFPEKEQLLRFMNSPLFNPHTTALFLQNDWKMVPEQWQKKFGSQFKDFDISRLEYVKAEDTGIDHSNPEIQSIFARPWGWDPGDAMNGSFRLANDTEVSALLNYFAGEMDCRLAFVLRKGDDIREEHATLNAGSNKNLTRSDIHFGMLPSGDYRFELNVPQDCDSKLDSLELVATDSELNEGGEVKILSYKPHTITISTSSKNAALLVLSEVSYPGWVAEMDHIEIPILRVNYALRAVAVAPGNHTIEFHFRPDSIYSGLAVTGVSLAGVLIYLWFQRRNFITPH